MGQNSRLGERCLWLSKWVANGDMPAFLVTIEVGDYDPKPPDDSVDCCFQLASAGACVNDDSGRVGA